MNEDCQSPANGLSPEPDAFLSSRLFRNDDLLVMTDSEKKIPRSKLVNKLNHLNFVDRSLSIIFFDKHRNQNIVLDAFPQPCLGKELTCHLVFDGAEPALADYQASFLMIDRGLDIIMVPVKTTRLQGHSLTVGLPEEGFVKAKRSTRRHRGCNAACEVILNDKRYVGRLVDFTPNAFSIQLSDGADKLESYPPDEIIGIDLYQNSVKVYSGACRCIRDGMNLREGRLVCAPVNEEARVFPKRITRNPRRQIAPSFTISFQHPFFPERIERDVFDISTSGFSIQDAVAEQTLMAGMIIPELCIHYAGIIEMKCSAQVVYCRPDQETGLIHCGFAVTDMDVISYSRLNHLVGAYLDPSARVSTTVDMEALWEFFFDTGFIYGEKYQHLYPYRNVFKETYRRLYQDNPEIARHFTYEKNGRIYGHIAMVHAYEPSWVIQHFSAKPLESKIPGLLILRQIIHYLNGCYRFRAYGIRYVMTYYRPDNRVVDKIFGGFARQMNNPKASSLDLFSYMHFDPATVCNPLPAGYSVRQCLPEDFDALKNFYETHSGGLVMDAFGLHRPEPLLEAAFHEAGFERNCRTYCLCRDGSPEAFFVVNRSDLGLNLSDLLNGISIFVVCDQLPWETILPVLSKLGADFATDQIPLLVYPSDYLPAQGVETSKRYQLWIMKTDPYAEHYTEYMRLNFRMRYGTAAKQ